MFKKLAFAFTLAALSAAAQAGATKDYVVNGSFNDVTGGRTGANGIGQLNFEGLQARGWTSGPDIGNPNALAFNFLLDPQTADTAGFVSEFSDAKFTNIFLWGPNTGSNNGLNASTDGGRVFGTDGGYKPGKLSQEISNLQVGHTYQLTFEWAAGQFTDRSGETTSGWQVQFGSEAPRTTEIPKVSGRGFRPWEQVTMEFTAKAAQQTLTFFALGTPADAPPFAMLDGVHMYDVTAVPEPAELSLFGAGLAVLALVARRRKQG